MGLKKQIKNLFTLNSGTQGGMDKSGRLYARCTKCNVNMKYVKITRKRDGIYNVYACPECKKIQTIKRHW